MRLARPGLEVKARRGYAGPSAKPPKNRLVEASAGTSKELREALDNPVEMSDFRFSLFAASLKGPGKKAAIAIVSQFRGQDIAFVQNGQQRTNALEISYVAVDRQGKVAGGNRERVELSLKPETYDRVLKDGFRVQSRFELAPGTYQLRVAAREAGGRLGSVHYDLDVPDYHQYLLLHQQPRADLERARCRPHGGVHRRDRHVLPGPPTAARTFSVREELALLAEVYDNDTRHSHSIYVTATLKAEGGSVSVFSNEETRSSRELGGKQGRLRLHDADPPQGARARVVRAEGGSEVEPARRGQREPRNPDPDRGLTVRDGRAPAPAVPAPCRSNAAA